MSTSQFHQFNTRTTKITANYKGTVGADHWNKYKKNCLLAITSSSGERMNKTVHRPRKKGGPAPYNYWEEVDSDDFPPELVSFFLLFP